MKTDIVNCARCGEDHAGMEFQEFVQKPDTGHTHWAMCPEIEQPILLVIVNTPVPWEKAFAKWRGERVVPDRESALGMPIPEAVKESFKAGFMMAEGELAACKKLMRAVCVRANEDGDIDCLFCEGEVTPLGRRLYEKGETLTHLNIAHKDNCTILEG